MFPEPADLAVRSAVEDLGRLSVADSSLDTLLRRVTDAATRLVPGRPTASLTVLRQGGFATLASSDGVAAELDSVQYRQGAGPCMEAAATGRPVAVADLRSDARWAALATAAAERGVRSVLSHPLPGTARASLNLYAGAPQAGDGQMEPLGRLAGYAAVPVANAYLYRSAIERAQHLEVALESRGVIDQAKGILMERFRLTADQAFEALARVSMERNVRVREVADRLVRTGEFPGD